VGMIAPSVHTRVGMIATMCVYKGEHDGAYVCIHTWAWLRLCVHTSMGMIAHMCAYTRGHDRAYMCIHA
jgi:uncharacterized membrane protein